MLRFVPLALLVFALAAVLGFGISQDEMSSAMIMLAAVAAIGYRFRRAFDPRHPWQ